MIKYSPFVSCGMNNITAINTIVKTCSVLITTGTKVKDTCIYKPPLPSDLFDYINSPISCITTTDIDDDERSNPYSLRDIAKCSTLPYENIPPSGLLGDENSNNTRVKRRWGILPFGCPFYFRQTYPPLRNYLPLNIVIWIMWSSYSFRFLEQSVKISNLIPVRKVPYPNFKFIFEIACSASSSTDVDALKLRLVQYDKFYSGEQQEDASECVMILIEPINKGSVPYCGSNGNKEFLYLKSYFHLC